MSLGLQLGINLGPRRAGGGVAPVPPTAPTLTRTSTAGTNPMSWSADYPSIIPDSDYIACRWRVNGGAWTTETEVLFTSEMWFDYLDGNWSYPWPLFDAAVFSGGQLVEVQEGVHRGSQAIVWSATLSDTMAASATYTHSDIYFSPNDFTTSHTWSNIPFVAGYGIVTFIGPSVSAATIGGVAATLLEASPLGNGYVTTFGLAGVTSGNKTVTATTASYSRVPMAAGTLVNVNTTPVATESSAPANQSQPHNAPTVTNPANGIAIGYFMEYGGASITPATVVSGTAIDEGNRLFNGETLGISVATSSAVGSVTLGWNFAFGTHARAVIVFGPQ